MSFLLGKNAPKSQSDAEEPNGLQDLTEQNHIQSKVVHYANAAAMQATPDPSNSIKVNGSE